MNQVERKVIRMNLEQDTHNDNQEPEITNADVPAEDKIPAPEPKPEETAADGHVQEAEPAAEPVESAEAEPENTAEDVSEVQAEEPAETVQESAEAEAEPLADEAAETAEAGDTESSEEDEIDADAYYAAILQRAAELESQNDWAFVSGELSNLRLQIEEGPEPESEESRKLINDFDKLRDEFETRKREYYEELNRKRQENLERKKELLKEFTDIINGEKWTATKEVSAIRHEWEQIKQLPHGEAEALNERFDSLMSDFEDHKVDRLVKKLQKEEENLTLKLVLQDKMDAILSRSESKESDFETLSREFNNLISQWRKVGHVPVDKNEAVWDRFNFAVDRFNELRYQFDSGFRKAIDKAAEQKKKLIAEAEQLADAEDLALAARRVNRLHKNWKKAKTLPQKDENELWEKFKAATDAFNQKKADNIDLLREQEQRNMELKEELIKKAESIQHTDDYEAGHKVMQLLMDEWKKIGPVPRKKSSKLWSSFKGAMDVFYEERREHFKDVRKDQKDNYTLKKEIIDKLTVLGEHEDPAAAVEEAKVLQEEFKNIGHVPIKSKNKIWKQYREACDVIYDRFRSLGADLSMERQLASQGVEPKDRKQVIKLEKELNNLKKDVSKLEAEIIQYEEAQTYFKPTKKGNKLLDELQAKIEKAASELSEKKDKIDKVFTEIDQLTNTEE